MKRINVIGTTGSGKSTFSEKLAEELGCPCIHMDGLFWKPNWTESSHDELAENVESAISGDSWVLDGNFNRTNDIKWKDVDTIIWLDYSFPRTFFQLLTRTVTRAATKEELWPGTGNRESFRQSFASRDSIFIWLIQSYKKNKVRYSALGKSLEKSHINFVRLKTPKDTNRFLKNYSREPT